MKTFAEFFDEATSGEQKPFPYQIAFAESADLPELVHAPTGSGKTATAILGWLWRYFHSGKETPRRLVYCLPMRVLVEQTVGEARKWLRNLTLDEKVKVHVLMGGVDSEEWHLDPEKPAILIGTQDMLLSRALNRGYAASRFRWPVDFGLLNNDCLWVFDEPQLMANGVSTSAQLAGLRKSLTPFGLCPSVWMSATLEPSWLDTIDFRGKILGKPLELDKADYDPNLPLNKRMTAAKILAPLGVSSSKDMKDVARAVIQKHDNKTQTIVVLNTVDRAKAVFAALQKNDTVAKNLLLVHSRFRPAERELLNFRLQEKGDATIGRIIVATQVVEAGVDISSRTLITELAPWASIVQRFGRCNRAGNDGSGQVFWIDLEEKLSLPYETVDLEFSRIQLKKLQGSNVSPKDLNEYKKKENFELRFEHKHVFRRRDLIDLFDTAPDLSGNDIDIQRFVRSDDPETDVKVFWRVEPPSNDSTAEERRRQGARRRELCNVPIGSFKKEFVEAGKTAYRFDYLDGEWRTVGKKDLGTIIPGQMFWVTADQGGYDRQVGWSPASGPMSNDLLIPLPEVAPQSRRQRPEGFYDSDEWAVREWRTLTEHTEDVCRELKEICDPQHVLPLTSDLIRLLVVAVRWHDWGKMHPVFQSGICEEIDDPRDKKLAAEQRRKKTRRDDMKGRSDVAKAPDEFWRRYRRQVSSNKWRGVKRFRHELASALGVIQLFAEGRPPGDWASLDQNERWLALYLIAAHHGKVRMSIRAMPEERPIPHDLRKGCASGVWDGDKLPSADLGGDTRAEEVELSIKPMQLGGNTSWTGQVLELLKQIGPFRLAYLEAIVRAADCRASGPYDVESEANG